MKITDEMVEAAIHAHAQALMKYGQWGNESCMRAALTAALATQPDRYREGFEKAREMAAEIADNYDTRASEIRNMEMTDE